MTMQLLQDSAKEFGARGENFELLAAIFAFVKPRGGMRHIFWHRHHSLQPTLYLSLEEEDP